MLLIIIKKNFKTVHLIIYIYMNPDYINNSIIENTLNKFSYRPFAQNIEPYLSLKTTNNN